MVARDRSLLFLSLLWLFLCLSARAGTLGFTL